MVPYIVSKQSVDLTYMDTVGVKSITSHPVTILAPERKSKRVSDHPSCNGMQLSNQTIHAVIPNTM